MMTLDLIEDVVRHVLDPDTCETCCAFCDAVNEALSEPVDEEREVAS